MTTKDCTLCNGPRVEYAIEPSANGAQVVRVAMCKTCDHRKCKEGHIVSDLYARKCQTCGEFL